MKHKSIFLLSIFIISLVPNIHTEAAQSPSRTLSDALLLMYVSDALLLEESDLDLTISGMALASPSQEDAFPSDDAVLAAMIHSAKQRRNDLDAKCRAAESTLRQSKRNCALDKVKSYCETQRNAINGVIGFLHKQRGDKRKRLTIAWHRLKRSARNLWHWIGKPGRAFFRQVGPEALKIVLSGGSLGGGVAKKLIKQTAKSMFKERISQAAFQRIEKLLIGQIEIMRAAGVDICEEEKDQAQTEPSEEDLDDSQSDGLSPIPDEAYWECEDISGYLTMLKTKQGPDTQVLKSELTFWLVYKKNGPAIHAFFYYDVLQNYKLSTGEWESISSIAQAEDTSIPVDESGVFQAKFDIKGQETGDDFVQQILRPSNIYGLISPDNYETAYVCDVGTAELPTDFHTLSPENFQDRCYLNYYYECRLTSQ